MAQFHYVLGEGEEMKVTKIFDWHCAHYLVGHKGLCKNNHGHKYLLEVEVEGETQKKGSSNGMIIDFSDLKSFVKREIIDKFDHAWVLWDKEKKSIEFAKTMHWKVLKLPFNTTAENMTVWILKRLRESNPHNFKITKVRLYETDTSFAEATK